MTTSILKHLIALQRQHSLKIDEWFDAQFAQSPAYITSSMDLRHSGSRIVPVDTNLFPAGFNNLSATGIERAKTQFKAYFAKHAPAAKRLLIFTESHTRNLAYLENLVVLRDLLQTCGFDVRLGSLAAQAQPLELTSINGHPLREESMLRVGSEIHTADGFIPDAILLNSDLTPGIPPLLESISQPVFPPADMGWHRRRKSTHFLAYQQVAGEFATKFGFDPWLINAIFYRCGMVDFRAREGMDTLAKAVDCVLEAIAKKYAEYGITQAPYVFVKADSGTYGMGIMTAYSGAEFLELNKKDRNKMQVIKEGVVNSEVIIQEGIPTIDVIDGKVAEPMIYLVGGVPVGGMYRLNGQRDALSNLNAAGMEFTGMCDEQELGQQRIAVAHCDFGALGLIAKLASLAAAREDYSVALQMPKLCA